VAIGAGLDAVDHVAFQARCDRQRLPRLASSIARQSKAWTSKFCVDIWDDGVYLQARMDVEKQGILVLIGVTPESGKELIGF
jgi:hypothetical protein